MAVAQLSLLLFAAEYTIKEQSEVLTGGHVEGVYSASGQCLGQRILKRELAART